VTHKLITKLLGAGTAAQHTTQFHPNLTFEKPLWDAALTPYLIAGHYFYSQDPAVIESVAGRPRFAASSTRLNSLVGGLLNNNGSVGVRFPIGHLVVNPSIGAEQSATDLTWATVQDITLKYTLFGNTKLKLDWDRTIQFGVTSDLFTGGITYVF
jgi:hypothetical protein